MIPSHGTPRVSVLLPVRNAAPTLPAALASIKTQTMTDWELLLIDDGSTDETATIAEQHAFDDDRVRVLRQPPLGLVPALARGLAVARGPFIARMDADDVSHPDRLAAQLDLLIARPEIGVASCLVGFGGDAEASRGYSEHVAWLNGLITPEAMALARFIEAPLAHPSTLFRRELIERHGGYRDGPFPEDYELWLRWFDGGVRFAKVNRSLYTWNDAPTRLSRTDSRYAPDAFYATKCVWLARHLSLTLRPERPVWLWGAGRVTRKRFKALESAGCALMGFVDIDPKKIGGSIEGRPVRAPAHIPSEAFVLIGVGNRGARDLILAHLRESGRREGHDFLCVA